MCTVTYIPQPDGFILTSNRDEKIYRPTLLPDIYSHHHHQMIYPKDQKAGGTWIAASLDQRFACLLNGAFTAHQKQPHHTKSRGKVLLESFQYTDVTAFAQLSDFSAVEPFTLLLFKGKTLYECKWDGKNKFLKKVSNDQPAIWSSSTLYSEETRNQREQIFYDWLRHYDAPSAHDLFDFHGSKHAMDDENGILMQRTGGLQTLSITQIHFKNNSFRMHYQDLKEVHKNVKVIDSSLLSRCG